jgi:hypothetical protein
MKNKNVNTLQNEALNKADVSSSLFYKIQLILLSPFWLLSTSPSRKSWKEFKNGLIKHECKYDYSKPSYDTGKHYKCEHLGCNIVSVRNEDGSWC